MGFLSRMNQWDFVIFAFMIASAIFGGQRGLQKTLTGIAGTVISLLCGALIPSVLVEPISNALQKVSYDSLSINLASHLPAKLQSMSGELASAVVWTLGYTIVRRLLFLLIFLLALSIWHYFCIYSALPTKFPKVDKKPPDNIAGAIAGLVKGFLIACIFLYACSLLGIIASYSIRKSFFLPLLARFFRFSL